MTTIAILISVFVGLSIIGFTAILYFLFKVAMVSEKTQEQTREDDFPLENLDRKTGKSNQTNSLSSGKDNLTNPKTHIKFN